MVDTTFKFGPAYGSSVRPAILDLRLLLNIPASITSSVTLSESMQRSPSAPLTFCRSQPCLSFTSSGHTASCSAVSHALSRGSMQLTLNSFRSCRTGMMFGPRSRETTTLYTSLIEEMFVRRSMFSRNKNSLDRSHFDRCSLDKELCSGHFRVVST